MRKKGFELKISSFLISHEFSMSSVVAKCQHEEEKKVLQLQLPVKIWHLFFAKKIQVFQFFGQT